MKKQFIAFLKEEIKYVEKRLAKLKEQLKDADGEELRDPPRFIPMPNDGKCPDGYYPNDNGGCTLDVG